MAKRITIMIDDDVHKKLKLIQSKEILKSEGSVSFSQVLNNVVKGKLK